MTVNSVRRRGSRSTKMAICTLPIQTTIPFRNLIRPGSSSLVGARSRPLKKDRSITRVASRGADRGRFDVPWGLTTDQEGSLYVSDTSNARIQKFKADGTPVLKWGRDGSFDGAFFFPRGVAVDFVGNIYVT